MGIQYNSNDISQKTTDAKYPYYNDSQVNQVYYNGTLVWKKYTPLEFTFDSNKVTGYTGSSATITIPSTYSVITEPNGNKIFIEGSDITVTEIADDAFTHNTTLTSVTIPDTITKIGARAFQFCYNLATVSLSADLSYVGYCAFALTNLSQPSSYMYNAATLGQGCFAFRNAYIFQQNKPDLDIATRIAATNLGVLSNEGYTGQGLIYAAKPTIAVVHTSGADAPSGTYTVSGYMNGRWIARYDDISITSGKNNSSTYGNSWIANGTEAPVYTTDYTGSGTNIHTITGVITHSDNNAGKVNHITFTFNFVSTCLAEGTLITLANGTQKPVEQVTHKDLLLIWNFETGAYDYQYPLVVGDGSLAAYKTRITLEDNTYIEICNSHDIYDPVANIFRKYGEGAISKLSSEPLYVLQYTNKNSYECKKIINIEIVWEQSKCYCLMTSGSITAFANNIMIGSDFLNHTNITNKNKFPNSFTEDQALCYTYDRFKGEIYPYAIKYLTLGLNLNYLHYYYEEGVTNFQEIFAPFLNKLRAPIKNNKYVCTIGILDGDTLTESEYLEDEEIILPEIKDSNKSKWYIVGEYKYLNPGDKYKINFSTLIRSV